MKRKKTGTACFLCEKTGAECDNQRPCGRCSQLGTPHMCIGNELGSGLAYSKINSAYASNAAPALNKLPVPQSSVATTTPDASTTAIPTTVQSPRIQIQPTNTPTQPVASTTNTNKSIPVVTKPVTTTSTVNQQTLQKQQLLQQQQLLKQQQLQQQQQQLLQQQQQQRQQPVRQQEQSSPINLSPISPTITSSKSPQSININNGTTTQPLKTEIKQEEKPINSVSPTRTYGSVYNNTKPQQPEVPSYQLNINTFLMQELKKLKDDQERLNSEILSLKIQNLKLSSKYEDLNDQFQVAKTNNNFTNYYGNLLTDSQKAMVVFDLTKNPAVVLTTNETFCKMLGYEMKEVLGAPWRKFVPPEYIDHTMRILAQRSNKGDPVIQIEQIYRHKEAGIFATVDTHKIFYSNGKPVSDLVFITLSTPHKLSSGGASPPASPAVVATTSPQTTQRGRVLSIEDQKDLMTPENLDLQQNGFFFNTSSPPSSPPPATVANDNIQDSPFIANSTSKQLDDQESPTPYSFSQPIFSPSNYMPDMNVPDSPPLMSDNAFAAQTLHNNFEPSQESQQPQEYFNNFFDANNANNNEIDLDSLLGNEMMDSMFNNNFFDQNPTFQTYNINGNNSPAK